MTPRGEKAKWPRMIEEQFSDNDGSFGFCTAVLCNLGNLVLVGLGCRDIYRYSFLSDNWNDRRVKH
jgi:hypothetical protein